MLNWFQNLKIKNKILLGNAAAIFLLAGFALTVYSSVTSLKETQRWVSHTEKTIATGHKLMEGLLDMETGQRGFLITGKEEFLEPYTKCIKVFNRKIEEAKTLVSDNPVQVRKLEEIEELTARWIREAGEKQSIKGRMCRKAQTAIRTWKRFWPRERAKEYWTKSKKNITE